MKSINFNLKGDFNSPHDFENIELFRDGDSYEEFFVILLDLLFIDGVDSPNIEQLYQNFIIY